MRIVIDDGRNFVLTDDGSYDVIELEPPEIFTAGVINLYTREFYRDAAARLAPEGILIQWLPVGEAPLEQERMLFRSFTDVFPHATAWRQLEDGADPAGGHPAAAAHRLSAIAAEDAGAGVCAAISS